MAIKVDVSLDDKDKKNSKSYRIKLSNTEEVKELFPDLDLAIQFLDGINIDTDKNKTAKLLSDKINKSVLETSEVVIINKDELAEAITSDIVDMILRRWGMSEEAINNYKSLTFTYPPIRGVDMLNYFKKLEAKRSKRLLNCKPYLSRKYKKALTKLIRKLIISLNNKYSLKPNIKEVIRFQH